MTTLRKLRVGRWAVLTAAYALLLNVMLTTSLLASVQLQTFDPLHELCAPSILSDHGATDPDTQHKPVIHCPLCLAHNAFSFIAPSAPELHAPTPVTKIAELPLCDTQHTIGGLRTGWARGPPSLV